MHASFVYFSWEKYALKKYVLKDPKTPLKRAFFLTFTKQNDTLYSRALKRQSVKAKKRLKKPQMSL